ncbi:hypothetical protein GALMADRAFT_238510 [Galerina marginata CBS 339.88]|uniref:Arrestin-like N-terminal domain-containing protein n=1 Tax=Galerina marginata (strain CBS 339.88) TaxID=685588 RepID=A0A067TKL2_GALM3|nr:hypothetical protein GALMADRAFT_238510 [Galerina marginata CBS 339.88]
MSTVSLPSYIAPSLNQIPSYSAEPHSYEQRLALGDRLRARPSGNFIKQSKGGGIRLRLSAQENNVALPIYGSTDVVEGTVELSRPEAVTSVEVQIEGRLRLKEIAEGGTAVAELCLDTALLWTKDTANTLCPTSLHFSLGLPSTFTYEEKTYPLPPTFDVKLSGLPGFVATIDYSVTTIVGKSNGVPMPKMKSRSLGIHVGSTVVSTPFVYYPRSRPSSPIPPPLQHGPDGFIATPDWKVFESVLHSKSSTRPNIVTKLYVPASRVFCMSKPIPFHLSLESSAVSLAAFLPMGPTANNGVSARKITRVQLMRQTTVDVRNTIMAGVKTDMWRVDCIGEGTFKHAGDGPSFMTYTGEIVVNDIKVPAFRAAGLSVKDCLLFTVTPLDPGKTPFGEVREVIPVRLSTESWTPNGAGIGRPDSALWESPTPPTAKEASNF